MALTGSFRRLYLQVPITRPAPGSPTSPSSSPTSNTNSFTSNKHASTQGSPPSPRLPAAVQQFPATKAQPLVPTTRNSSQTSYFSLQRPNVPQNNRYAGQPQLPRQQQQQSPREPKAAGRASSSARRGRSNSVSSLPPKSQLPARTTLLRTVSVGSQARDTPNLRPTNRAVVAVAAAAPSTPSPTPTLTPSASRRASGSNIEGLPSLMSQRSVLSLRRHTSEPVEPDHVRAERFLDNLGAAIQELHANMMR